jgi:hypothetical protein
VASHFYVDLLLFGYICPVELACLLRKDFKSVKLFAIELDDLNDLKGSVDHLVSWLEADQLREGERCWQEGNYRHQLKQSSGTALIFCVFLIDYLDWPCMQPCQVKWDSSPIAITDLKL